MAKTESKKAEAVPAMKYTSYEKARLIGARALQISMGARFTVQLDDAALRKINFNPIEVAKLEYAEGKIPIDIRRRLPE